MRTWSLKILLVVSLLNAFCFAAEKEEPREKTSVGEAIQSLHANAQSLAESMRELQVTFPRVRDTFMKNDANLANRTTYQVFIKDIMQTESVDSKQVFIAPNRMRTQSGKLWEWWQAGRSDDDLRAQFKKEVHPAYVRTMVTAYVYAEYIRRVVLSPTGTTEKGGTYEYKKLFDDSKLASNQRLTSAKKEEYKEHLYSHLLNLHTAAQGMMSNMIVLRADDTFKDSTPDWEGLYGDTFHKGKTVPKILSNPKRVEITDYFDPFYYPSLVPNTEETAKSNSSTSSSSVSSKEEEPATNKKEAQFILDNLKLQRLIARGQYLEGFGNVKMNDDMTRFLETLQEELEKVEDAPDEVDATIKLVKALRSETDIDGAKLKQKLSTILATLRPGRGPFSPPDMKKLQAWKWDEEKGLVPSDAAKEKAEEGKDKEA